MGAPQTTGSGWPKSIAGCRAGAVIALAGSLMSGYTVSGSNVGAGAVLAQPAVSGSVEIDAQTVRYSSGSASIEAYLVIPAAGGNHPAVIVVHDDRGLNEAMRGIARAFAAAGFVALAPNLPSRMAAAETSAQRQAGRGPQGSPVARLSVTQTVQDVRAAFTFLRNDARVDPTRISAAGVGWGGWRTLKMAEDTPTLYRAVVFYGVTPTDDRLEQIQAPVLAHYAEYDFLVNATAIRTQQRLGRRFTYHIYPDMDRGFFGGGSGPIDYTALVRARPEEAIESASGDTGSPEVTRAVRLAWGRTLSFLRN